MNKLRGRQPSISLDTQEQDECVEDAINIILGNLDQHIADKFLFPRVVAHGVGRIVAEMVNTVCISHVQRMESWLVELDGSAPEEWDLPQEPTLPPIDCWARGIVPLRKPELVPADVEKEEAPPVRPVRRASTMPLSQYKGIPTTTKSENKGSLRRFTDSSSLLVSRRVSFQENLTTVIEASKSMARDVTKSCATDSGSPALDSKTSVKKSGTKTAATTEVKKTATLKDANFKKKEVQDKRQPPKRTSATGLSKTTPKTQSGQRVV